MPSVPVDPTPNQGLSPAAMAQLTTAELFKNDVVETTNKVRLEMLALQFLTNKKKLLAEAKLQQDKEDRLQKKATDGRTRGRI